MDTNSSGQQEEKQLKKGQPTSVLKRFVGVVLCLPAILTGFVTVFIPLAGTLYLSLQKYSGLTPPVFIGLQNYTMLFSAPTIQSALAVPVYVAGVTLLLVGFSAPLACLGGVWVGKNLRLALRLLLCLPLAAFVPFFWVICWSISFGPGSSIGASIRSVLIHSPLGDKTTAALVFVLASALFVAGLVNAATGLFFLSIRPDQKKWLRSIVTVGVVWLSGIFAALASISQDFIYPAFFPGTSGNNALQTVATEIYKLTFSNMMTGQGAALSSLLIVMVVVLGLLTTLLVAASGIHITWNPPDTDQPKKPTVGVVMLLVGILGLLVTLLAGLLPLVGAALVRPVAGVHNGPTFQVNVGVTLAQFLPLIFFQLPLTYLAALGIGGFRPLGRASEWLLLLFGGGLFLTFLPLQGVAFWFVRTFHLLNTIPGLLLGGCILNIPMLFILTLFFKGQNPAWQERLVKGEGNFGAFLRSMLLPSLPLVLLSVMASAVVTLWDVTWPMVVLSSREMLPLSLWLVRAQQQQSGSNMPVLLSIALSHFILGLIILIPAQIFYLDRLEVKRNKA